MGIGTLLKKQVSATDSKTKTNYGAMFLSAFSVGITNPAAVLTFLFAFSYFGINGKLDVADGSALVAGVLIGTLIWWITLSAIARKIKDKFGEKGFTRLNKYSG
ncbi:MAG: LysE family transporter [Oscillospiraceae bacterium]|nr:LysE family transporter [Oscillospiraceae bacterium]